MGLVNKVVPLADLEIETVAWARKMLDHSPLALRMLKASMNAADDGLAGIQQLAGDATLLYYMTEEAQEGKNAYLEKRRPDFDKYPKRPLPTPSNRRPGTPGMPVIPAPGWRGAALTLAAAIAPVLVGTAAGTIDGPIRWGRAIAALVVALALQVGVNYANDYSDGVRGTDKDRRGPIRLVASGLALPAAVHRAGDRRSAASRSRPVAFSLVVRVGAPPPGLAALRWRRDYYTGGPKPYGYLGLGEVMVLAFFGFVATVGSAYVQYRQLPGAAWWSALAVGLPACAILLANNVRDVETDARCAQAHVGGSVRRAARPFALRPVASSVHCSVGGVRLCCTPGRCSGWRRRSRSLPLDWSAPAPIRRRSSPPSWGRFASNSRWPRSSRSGCGSARPRRARLRTR